MNRTDYFLIVGWFACLAALFLSFADDPKVTCNTVYERPGMKMVQCLYISKEE